ncbi:MAG: IPT/TIG domain-containing protein [Deltaproteobacteria bacterium]|nr:IPT/TIG domain-containing protein [Deltaproteobacteria bacterium]
MVRLFPANFVRFFALVVLTTACSEQGADFPETIISQSPPFLKKVDPAAVHRGDVLTLYGLGFSIVPEENNIRIGGIAVSASASSLNNPVVNDSPEKLTVTIPQGVADGEQAVSIFVIDQPSNGDLKVTVLP